MIAAAAVAEFGAVILLSFFYSGERTGPGDRDLPPQPVRRSSRRCSSSRSRTSAQFARLTARSQRLEGTSAQIGVRGDFALIAVVAGVASQLGLETILAAFTVGVIRGMTSGTTSSERSASTRSPSGIFIPFFFVDSGMDFDLGALFASFSSFIRLPLFVLAVLIVRALPALIYRPASRPAGPPRPGCSRRRRSRSSSSRPRSA